MPPIMGTSAFIMAELTGLPYFKIAVAAVIPAILYYLGILVYMYGATQSLNVQRLDISVTTSKLALMKKYWSVILALVWFVYRIVIFYPLEYAALECAGMVLVAGDLDQPQPVPASILSGEYWQGGSSAASLTWGFLVAISGVLVGVILATGLGIEFAGFVTFLGKQSITAALVCHDDGDPYPGHECSQHCRLHHHRGRRRRPAGSPGPAHPWRSTCLSFTIPSFPG